MRSRVTVRPHGDEGEGSAAGVPNFGSRSGVLACGQCGLGLLLVPSRCPEARVLKLGLATPLVPSATPAGLSHSEQAELR